MRMNAIIRAFDLSPSGRFPSPSSSSSLKSQMESERLPKDDLKFESCMQSTAEQNLRQDRSDKSRIPLEVRFENLLALLDSVVASAITASAISHESSDQVTAHSLDDSLFQLRIWLENIKAMVPDAETSPDILRILGKLKGPGAATFLNVLGAMETDLKELSADTADKSLYGQAVT